MIGLFSTICADNRVKKIFLFQTLFRDDIRVIILYA